MNVAFATLDVNSQSDISERYARRMDRAERMRKLIDDRFGGVQADFARAIGRSSAVVWQYLSGHRSIGEKFARHVESKLNLPRGYLDGAQPSADNESSAEYLTAANVAPGPELKGKVPLISWVQAGCAQEVMDIYHPGVADEWIDTTVQTKEHTYALRVEGDSMTPNFPPGTILIVEPDMPAEIGDYVIAKNGDEEATFKQLAKDAGQWFLKPLNTQYPTIPMGDYQVIGVVREAVQRFR